MHGAEPGHPSQRQWTASSPQPADPQPRSVDTDFSMQHQQHPRADLKYLSNEYLLYEATEIGYWLLCSIIVSRASLHTP